MKKIIVGMTMLCTALMFAACEPAANNATTANKPANMANAANSTTTSSASADADVKK